MYLEGGTQHNSRPPTRPAATVTSDQTTAKTPPAMMLTMPDEKDNEQHDSFDFDEDDEETAPSRLEKVRATQGIWFLPDLDRPAAELYLRHFELGVFIIRASSLARTLALSVNIPQKSSSPIEKSLEPGQSRVEHYLIESTGQQQLALEGSDVAFATLANLVYYYTENRLV